MSTAVIDASCCLMGKVLPYCKATGCPAGRACSSVQQQQQQSVVSSGKPYGCQAVDEFTGKSQLWESPIKGPYSGGNERLGNLFGHQQRHQPSNPKAQKLQCIITTHVKNGLLDMCRHGG